MATRIVFENNGAMGVVFPANNSKHTLEEIIAMSVPAGVSYSIVEDTDIPADRTFRNAWKLENGKPKVDMVKARGLHKENVEKAAKAKFDALIAQEFEADDDGDNTKKQQVKSQRKALRQAVKNLNYEAVTTPEELKALWPEGL